MSGQQGARCTRRSVRAVWRPVASVSLMALLALGARPGTAADAVFSSAAVEWQCGYESRRDEWDDMCMAWRVTMGEFGYTKLRANYSRLRLFRLTDPALASWGADTAHADSAVAALVCTHGRYPKAEQGWRAAMYAEEHGTCNLTSARRKYGRASGGKLRFVQASSCNSVPWPYRATWDRAAEGGTHVVAGFHGTMSISVLHVDQYRTMAVLGQVMGVAPAWVMTMYRPTGYAGRAYPNCPVARAYGDTAARAAQVLDERYGDNLADSAPQHARNIYIGGCDPKDSEDGEREFQEPLPL